MQQQNDGPTVEQMFSSLGLGVNLPSIRSHSASSGVTSSTIKHSASPQRYGSIKRLNKNGSLTPAAALAQYSRVLTPYEHQEIKQYFDVWFVGPTARKLNAGEGKGKNFGYDDEKGRYKCIKHDHIAYRFEVQKGLGKGSFGDVVRAYDHKHKTVVALKIIRNEKRFHKQGKCEVKILDHLRCHDSDGEHNVIHMKDYFIFRGHLCITFEMMHCDLYSALKKDSFRGFSLPRVQGFCVNLLKSLRLLKKLRIIHCDLKPENILLQNATSDDVKVIDLGSSCFDDQRVHTYIQSRFYRSPEVILGLSYGCAIDMWSLGCILSELHTGQPIFPGHNEKEQLMYQMQVLGLPPAELIKSGKRSDNFFNADGSPKYIVDRKGRTRAPGSRPLAAACGSSDPAFLDFLEKCMTWDSASRLTPDRAINHPFIRNLSKSHPKTAELIFGELSSAAIGTTEKTGSADSAQENKPPTKNEKTSKGGATPKKSRAHLGLLKSLKSRKSSRS